MSCERDFDTRALAHPIGVRRKLLAGPTSEHASPQQSALCKFNPVLYSVGDLRDTIIIKHVAARAPPRRVGQRRRSQYPTRPSCAPASPRRHFIVAVVHETLLEARKAPWSESQRRPSGPRSGKPTLCSAAACGLAARPRHPRPAADASSRRTTSSSSPSSSPSVEESSLLLSPGGPASSAATPTAPDTARGCSVSAAAATPSALLSCPPADIGCIGCGISATEGRGGR